MTTDPKPARQPREMPPGTAIAKLRALGSCADFVEQRVEDAVNKAQDEGIRAWEKEVNKILGKVHPSVRDAVKEAGVVPDATEAEYDDKAPADAQGDSGVSIASDADDLPAGARDYTPGPAARAARGTR